MICRRCLGPKSGLFNSLYISVLVKLILDQWKVVKGDWDLGQNLLTPHFLPNQLTATIWHTNYILSLFGQNLSTYRLSGLVVECPPWDREVCAPSRVIPKTQFGMVPNTSLLGTQHKGMVWGVHALPGEKIAYLSIFKM